MRFQKPQQETEAEKERRKQSRIQYLREATIALHNPRPAAPPPPPNACCPKAYVVECPCGGARECPDHPGPVCFGTYSHD